MPDLSVAIEKLLAHPELLASVASVLGKPPPSTPPSEPTDASVEQAPPPVSNPLPESLATLAPLLSGLGKGGSFPFSALTPRGDDPRICLLRALQPYLSAGRCEAIDTMIRLAPLAELLRRRTDGSQGGH